MLLKMISTLVALLLTTAVAVAQTGTQQKPPPPNDITDRFDVGSVLGNPLLYYLLQSDAERNPEKAFLRVDDMRFQATVGTSGSLTRVAQYQPLDDGVKMKRLFYQREQAAQLFQLQWDYEGFSSARLNAILAAPENFHLKFTDNRVFHRLAGGAVVDFNLTPGASYERTWQRTQAEGDVALTRGGDVVAYGGLSVDKRNGLQAHSYFQIHRFNCTDCHTLGFGRSVNYRTDEWWAGARARLPWQSAVVDARYRSSDFDNQGTNYTYNLGGPFGASTLFPNSGTRDRMLEYQGYAGPGNAPWRAGVHAVALDRSNSVSGQTRNARYVSAQAAGRLGNDITVTGSFYSQNEENSLSTNLSNTKRRLTLQATWTPQRNLSFTGRGGLDDRQYRINGVTAPEMHDAWFEMRGDWRPTKQVQVIARFRNDNVDHPYFPTDLARRSQTEVRAAYSTGEVTAGLQYDHTYGSNTINDFEQTDFLGFITARIAKRYLFSASFQDTTVNSNVAQTFFVPMPTGIAQLNPGIGGPLFLQSGLPYAAHNKYFQTSLTIPVGSKKSPVNITPSYRWVRTDTSANYLPIFPAVPLDSQVHIVQSVYGVRVDAPVWGQDQRLGVGWEHDLWRDAVNPSRGGTYDLFMINFSRRF